jgi:hypothetical protein
MRSTNALNACKIMGLSKLHMSKVHADVSKEVFAASGGELSQRMESLERYRDKKRRRLKRKVNADRR